MKKRFDAYSTKKVFFMPMGAILGKKEIKKEVVEPRVIKLRPGTIKKKRLRKLAVYSSKSLLDKKKALA